MTENRKCYMLQRPTQSFNLMNWMYVPQLLKSVLTWKIPQNWLNINKNILQKESFTSSGRTSLGSTKSYTLLIWLASIFIFVQTYLPQEVFTLIWLNELCLLSLLFTSRSLYITSLLCRAAKRVLCAIRETHRSAKNKNYYPPYVWRNSHS